ncbi:chromate transporter [Stemphylium lycopersici]|nr:chromate transporter [Stemphylium lycopersici]
MTFCIALLHAGVLPALFAFFLWSLPGAIGMYLLSLGVQNMPSQLPPIVYALLSGLNASTVGIVALAATVPVVELRINRPEAVKRRVQPERHATTDEIASNPPEQTPSPPTTTTNPKPHAIPLKSGLILLALFTLTFTIIMILRSTLAFPLPRPFSLFANMYLAGTIIFGGGPVVIPLLRSYVVEPGWVSARDFLLGLAVIQAFPGPNFNFAVFLGALAVRSSSQQGNGDGGVGGGVGGGPEGTHSIVGAILAFLAIFTPGIVLAVAFQSFWRVLRTRHWVLSLLRGINATAVGLVFTAVYRLWEIGYLRPESVQGGSLASEPWWVVVAALAYAETAWFGDLDPNLPTRKKKVGNKQKAM